MSDFLIRLLTHGGKLTEGASQVSLSYEGWTPGWAFFAGLVLAAGVIALYRFTPRAVSGWKIAAMTVLRILLCACFLALLTRPILFLTIEQPVRRTLLVLLDVSQSMNLKDPRVDADDLKRAALAYGALDPKAGLDQNPPADTAAFKGLSRLELLTALAGNTKINLWPRLHEKANLAFYGFGRNLSEIGSLGADSPDPGAVTKLTAEESGAFFKHLEAPENATAIGDSLRALLDEKRGQSIAGVFLITDGGNNSGIPLLQAAAVAAHDHLPLYIYGIGITSPLDIVVGPVSGPTTIPVKEKSIFTVKVKGLGASGRKAQLVFKANGLKIDEKEVDFHGDDEQDVSLSYEPPLTGDFDLEASIAPLEGESDITNNSSDIHVRVTDEKTRILYIEQEPHWDFMTLFAMMQRDRRLAPKVALLDGDPGLASTPDSLFIDPGALPSSQTDLAAYQIVVLGDVDPQRLGEERMKLLAQWVEQGGGLILLAGPHYSPQAYHGTPLESLFPVEISADAPAARYTDAVKLKLSPSGEISDLLAVSDVQREDDAIWDGFPAVFWTASVGKARPAAQALLVDPTPERATRDGAMPVIATQNYGSGQVVYIGTQETYTWRSHMGEKYYTRIWGQIIQALNPAKGASGQGKVMLRSDRIRYQTGDRIVISGTILDTPAEPVPGLLVVQPKPDPAAAGIKANPDPQQIELKLLPVPERPGEFRGETVARFAGACTFTVTQDPTAAVKFDVEEPKLEQSETAMNIKLLQAAAQAAGGTFLREEDLNGLPDHLVPQAAPSPTYKKIELVFTPWVLIVMLVLATLEWVLRRLSQLK